jgi:hypothetical protein
MYLEVAEELTQWDLEFRMELEVEKVGNAEKGVSPYIQ